MNSEVWFEVQAALQSSVCVTCIDLPGHGRSREVAFPLAYEQMLELLDAIIPENASLIGWSLGGLIAQGLVLRKPEKYNRLVLIASNAQFQQSQRWSCAMKPEVLDDFIKNLHENYRSTLQQFLMLQALGAEDAKHTIRELRQRLFLHGEPDPAALENGLLYLKNISLIDRLGEIKIPVMLVNGKLDSLVPVAAAEKMQKLIPHASLNLVEKAGHAPFLSHSERVITLLKKFLSS